ncbi:MAG: PIG-L deacetylase family protein [Candidatus Hodarchaeales archaeon]
MVEKKVVVAIYAHPDDGEFLAGGTLAKWVEQDFEVHTICATDGGLGTRVKGISREEVIQTRKEELENALEVIGAKKPIFLGYPDGFLREKALELKERLVYWYRKIRPDRIITLDPWKKYEVHPDHITIGLMASEAAVFSCFPLLYPGHIREGLEPHQPKEIWFMVPIEHKPNRLVDITLTLDKKIGAVLCHGSQVEMLADMFVPGVDVTNLTEEQKSQLSEGARTLLTMVAQGIASLSEGKMELAEAFYAIKIGAGHFNIEEEFLKEMIGLETGSLEFH